MNQPDFVVKCYNKQDLAQMYFPDITVRASVNKLRRWMRRCQPLMDEILSTDFHPKTKAFSVREVIWVSREIYNLKILLLFITMTTGGSTFAISRSFFITLNIPFSDQSKDMLYESRH